MKENVLFIATVSWEPRFLEGARRILSEGKCSKALCFWFEDYEDRSTSIREQFVKEFAHLSPKLEKLRLLPQQVQSEQHSSPSQTDVWRRIFDVFSKQLTGVERFMFDITTTPREALWVILDLLTEAKIPGTLVYHRADKHGSWCGSDPDRPHIVPKLGGISALDKPTKLLILTGFDEDRSEHFIMHYEPQRTLILLQEVSGNEEAERNRRPHLARFGGRQGVDLLSMNSYAPDWGYASLEKAASEFGGDSNLVLASVGPKTSAASLYRVHLRMPQSALVYSPCRAYSEDYSTGIGETLRLVWNSAEITAHSQEGQVNC